MRPLSRGKQSDFGRVQHGVGRRGSFRHSFGQVSPLLERDDHILTLCLSAGQKRDNRPVVFSRLFTLVLLIPLDLDA